jgi:NAD(P)H-dependent FMN reductase
MAKIGIIVGSTRPGRNSQAIADWVFEQAKQRTDATFELVDLKDFNLPLLDEPISAFGVSQGYGQYQHEHTRKWSAAIGSLDGFIFVTPEYNHSVPGALKNSFDFLYPEWNDKAAAVVSYGSAGGVRAAEQLRVILAELQVATVRAEVNLSTYTDFERFKNFNPSPSHEMQLSRLFDQLVAWTSAFAALRLNQKRSLNSLSRKQVDGD